MIRIIVIYFILVLMPALLLAQDSLHTLLNIDEAFEYCVNKPQQVSEIKAGIDKLSRGRQYEQSKQHAKALDFYRDGLIFFKALEGAYESCPFEIWAAKAYAHQHLGDHYHLVQKNYTRALKQYANELKVYKRYADEAIQGKTSYCFLLEKKDLYAEEFNTKWELKQTFKLNEAEITLEKKLYEHFGFGNYLFRMAALAENLAALHNDQSELQTAFEYLDLAERAYRDLSLTSHTFIFRVDFPIVEISKKSFVFRLANVLKIKAGLLEDIREYEDAAQLYAEAIQLRESMVESPADAIDLGQTLVLLSELYRVYLDDQNKSILTAEKAISYMDKILQNKEYQLKHEDAKGVKRKAQLVIQRWKE